MSNPAALLLSQLQDWRPGSNESAEGVRGTMSEPELLVRHEIAMSHIGAIRELLATVESLRGHSMRVYRDQLPVWTRMVLSHPHGWASAEARFEREPLILLETLVPQLDGLIPEITEERRQTIESALTEFIDLLSTDQTVSPDLRAYLASLLAHIRQVLTEYEIRGDFDLLRAIALLRTAVDMAAESSQSDEHRSRWSDLRNRFVVPNIVPAMIAAASVFGQFALS